MIERIIQECLARISTSYKLRKAKEFTHRLALPFIAAQRRLILRRKLRRSEVHIHFGCGKIDDSRFINVDARPFTHVDLVTNSPKMKEIPGGCAHSIYACHVFEHIPYAQQDYVLARWLELLRPGGRLILSVPDFDKLIYIYEKHRYDIKAIQGYLMGGQDYAGNFHFAIFNREHLVAKLEKAGFTNIDHWDPKNEIGWPQDHSWDNTLSLNIAGEKPI